MFIYSLFRMPFLGLRTSQLKCEVRKKTSVKPWRNFMLFFENVISIQQLTKVECDGLLISFSFKLFILAIGTWAVFYRYLLCMAIISNSTQNPKHYIPLKRRPRASLPRIHLFRGLITLLLALFLVAFWLFYGVRYTFLVITCLPLTFFLSQ